MTGTSVEKGDIIKSVSRHWLDTIVLNNRLFKNVIVYIANESYIEKRHFGKTDYEQTHSRAAYGALKVNCLYVNNNPKLPKYRLHFHCMYIL